MNPDLVLVLGDQLDPAHAALAAVDRASARVLMIETAGEAAHAWSHKQRIAVFLSAMRHFAARLEDRGWTVDYRDLDAGTTSLAAGIEAAVAEHRPGRVVMVEAGEWRVEHALRTACGRAGVPLEILPDRHFYARREEFAAWAQGRKRLVMEFFYRHMRRRQWRTCSRRRMARHRSTQTSERD